MSATQCRLSVSSGHSVSYQARESKMNKMMMRPSVTESTHAPCGPDEEEAVVRFSIIEHPSAVEESHRDSVCSSLSTPEHVLPKTAHAAARKSHLSTEQMCAVQKGTNSLHFQSSNRSNCLLEEAARGRPRSASYSVPRSRSKEATDDAEQLLWKFNFGRRGGQFPRIRKMRLEEYKALDAEERRWNFSKTKRVLLTEDVPKKLRTSVMLRCIPQEYTRNDILHLLQEQDFGEINFLYLMMNFQNGFNAGYCFINFRFPEDAWEFKARFSGHVFSEQRPEERAHVQWRYPVQGFASHFDQFKGSYVTHAKLPEQFKPALVRDGKAVRFPKVWYPVRECKKICRYIRDRNESTPAKQQ